MTDHDERSKLRQAAQAAVSVALVVFIFGWAVPRLADYAAIWAAIRSLSAVGIVAIIIASLVNLYTYWWPMVVALPGLTYARAAVVHQASTAAAHVLPAGGALAIGLNYAMYSSWGFTPGPIARSILITGVWNNLTKFAFPVVALVLLAFEGGASTALITAAAFGLILLAGAVVLLGLVLKSEPLSRTVGRLAARLVSRLRRIVNAEPVVGWDDGAARFREEAVDLLRTRGGQLTIATLASHAAIFGVLLVALRALGVSNAEVGWIEALAAFSFVRLITALPITPGGLGVIELGLLAALTADLAPGPTAEVAAAILLFRFITFVMPVAMGGLAYVLWRRLASWRRADPTLTQ